MIDTQKLHASHLRLRKEPGYDAKRERVAEVIFLAEGRNKDVSWADADRKLALIDFRPGVMRQSVQDCYREIADWAIAAMEDPK